MGYIHTYIRHTYIHTYIHTYRYSRPIYLFRKCDCNNKISGIFTLVLCMKLGYSLGIGKSLKDIISLLVFMMVDLITHPSSSCTFSVNFHSPPSPSVRSKHTGSRLSSTQHLMAVRPLQPAPITAILFAMFTTLAVLQPNEISAV